MWKMKYPMVLALCMGIFAVLGVRAQQNNGKTPAPASTLTAQDYVEIQQLIYSYPYTLDTGEGRGYVYADLFTADGSFGKTKGREALAALAWQHRKGQGPLYTRQFVTNIIINPSPGGAVGKAYMAAIESGEGGKPGTIEAGGHYEDVYVKTPAGWRFKTRTFIAAKAGPAPAPSQTPSSR